MARISQREARRLRKRVAELESADDARLRRWTSEWPSSTVIHRFVPTNETLAVINTARALNHAVVVTMQNDKLTFWGCKP